MAAPDLAIAPRRMVAESASRRIEFPAFPVFPMGVYPLCQFLMRFCAASGNVVSTAAYRIQLGSRGQNRAS
jgi:hypothetical protein